MADNRVRPSALLPFWNIAGFALGAGTALLGKEAAMACTVAVEDVIGDHYNSQIRQLVEDNPEKHKELLEIVKTFWDEELHHHDVGLENDAEKAPFYKVLTEAIKIGCKGTVWISEKYNSFQTFWEAFKPKDVLIVYINYIKLLFLLFCQ